MKTIYFTILAFFAITISFSQNVNIPDANFKKALLAHTPKIDTNNDGEIQISEATIVRTLKVKYKEIASLEGIEAFTDLKNLECTGNKITTIDVSKNVHLEYLAINMNPISDIDLSGNPALIDFDCTNSELTTLDFSKNTALKQAFCSMNKLTKIDTRENPLLETLRCSGNQLTSLNLGKNTALKRLQCDSNKIFAIDISENTALEFIDCSDNELTTLDLNNKVNLSLLDCSLNKLELLTINDNINLSYLNCNNNLLTNLDLSGNPKLYQVDCSANLLQFLSLKVGNSLNDTTNCQWNRIQFDNNPTLTYICADEVDLKCLQNKVDELGYDNCVVGTYCSITPGGDYYTVSGKVNYDSNNDGCDKIDSVFPGLKIIVTGTNYSAVFISNKTGRYTFHLEDEGVYEVSPVLENLEYFKASPASFTVNFPTDPSPYLQDICIAPDGVKNDLEVVVIPPIGARPGFIANYKVFYKNKGNTKLSGTVTLGFEDDFMNFEAATPVVDQQIPNLLTWNFTDLEPFEEKTIEVAMLLNKPTDTPPLNDGDLLHFAAIINPITDDKTPTDNTHILTQTVVNSMDPNDKTCLEGDTIQPDKIGDFVHYLIRFENTGTADAINIIVKDIIDTKKLDINSLTPLDASANFITRITNGNKVEFIFEDINLPSDKENNKGYVLFKIKTLPDLIAGDIFENTAEIFFDFNFPIITNKAQTNVSEPNGINDKYLNHSALQLYPNPSSELLNIKFTDPIQSVTIYDLYGRTINNLAVVGYKSKVQLLIKDLPKGTYLVGVTTKNNTYFKKLMKN